jgi:hypothetical protein
MGHFETGWLRTLSASSRNRIKKNMRNRIEFARLRNDWFTIEGAEYMLRYIELYELETDFIQAYKFPRWWI